MRAPYQARMADAMAARYGWTNAQRDAALDAIVSAPPSLPHPTRKDRMLPVDLHALALDAAAKVRR